MANFLTPEQQQMIAQQQAAAYSGMTPQQQQAMSAGYAGMTPQQQQAMAAQQQQAMAAQQQAISGQQPAPQVAPVAAGGSTIVVNLSDGCLVGFDRLRNVLILNGKVSNLTLPHRQIPARPATASITAITQQAVEDANREPVSKRGVMTKLGFKKSMLGESWQKRHFSLTADTLSYSKESSSSAINTIKLHKGVRVNVANASTPARRDRYEDGDHSMGSMMSQPIGQMMSETSGPLGKDFCVEVICPAQVGDMLGGVMNQSVAGLAFGGGMNAINKAKPRTYYLQCSSAAEAEEWRKAIQNNIECMAKPDLSGVGNIKPTAAGGYAGVDMSGLNNAMNYASSMQQSMENAKDPAKSLLFFQESLGTQIPLEELFAAISAFYDQLDAANVAHP